MTPAAATVAPWPRRALPWLLAGVVAVAFANAVGAAFLFDDHVGIVGDARLRRLLPLTDLLWPPMRALARLSFAANHAVGGLHPAGYHAVNVAIHIVNALILFTIARALFCRTALGRGRADGGDGLAWLVAALWAVHPLQTESVTYAVQRIELLAGTFTLLAVLAALRAAVSAGVGGALWRGTAVVACALGVSVKETAAVAPILALLLDAAFVGASLRAAWRARWGLYLAMAACWPWMLWLISLSPDPFPTVGHAEGGSALGQGLANYSRGGVLLGQAGLSPVTFALTQPAVVLHYLRLTVWPHPLCLDYAWPPVSSLAEAAAPLAALAAVGGTVAWLLVRHSRWGAAGAWFFVALGPTSSVLPIADLAFEHRMYLALAGPVALVVAAVAAGEERIAAHRPHAARSLRLARVALAAGVLAAWALTTARRNLDYRSEAAMWRSVVAARPGNLRAGNEWAVALSELGRAEDALAEYGRVIEVARARRQATAVAERYVPGGILRSNTADENLFRALANRGLLLERVGRRADGIRDYEAALTVVPDSAQVKARLDAARRSPAERE